MWNGDNCHTYDRGDFLAQLECGIRQNNNILNKTSELTYKVDFWPYYHDPEIHKCLEMFV